MATPEEISILVLFGFDLESFGTDYFSDELKEFMQNFKKHIKSKVYAKNEIEADLIVADKSDNFNKIESAIKELHETTLAGCTHAEFGIGMLNSLYEGVFIMDHHVF